VSDAKDYGDSIQTKYRYWILERNLTGEWSGRFEREIPAVFSRNGIPVVVSVADKEPYKTWSYLDGEDFFLFDFIYFLCQMGSGWSILPLHMKGNVDTISYSINVYDSAVANHQLRVFEQDDKIAGGYIPVVPFLCFHGDPSPESFRHGRRFETHRYKFGDSGGAKSNFSKAFAYGVAARLKEMEDLHIIDDRIMANAKDVRTKVLRHRQKRATEFEARQKQEKLRKEEEARKQRLALEVQKRQREIADIQRQAQLTASSTEQQNAYTIETLKWDKEKDFSCMFRVRLNGDCTAEAFFAVQKTFITHIRYSYLMAHPTDSPRSLVVDVRPNVENGFIVGRAEVLTIKPISLSYDANTRRGRLSVKFSPGQYEEARAWARKNIETLARDKNLVLVTGQLPPEARYYSLGETVKDGNVLEIEFRTE